MEKLENNRYFSPTKKIENKICKDQYTVDFLVSYIWLCLKFKNNFRIRIIDAYCSI